MNEETMQLRRVFSSVTGGSWGSEPGVGLVGLPCIRGTDFDYAQLRVGLERAPERWFSAEDIATRAVRAGDLIVEKSGGGEQQPVGRVVLYDHPVTAMPTNFAGRLRAGPQYLSRYVVYLMASLYSVGTTRACIKQTTGIQNLDLHALLATRVILPNINSQAAIADYLDAETARIDALINKRRRMVEALQERQARLGYDIIVGQGITGPRRSSRTPWLCDVPAAWDVAPVHSRYRVQLGRMLNAERASSGSMRPYLRNINVRWDTFDLTHIAEMDFPVEEREKYRLRPGDLLVCEGGAGVGRAAIWRGQIEECYFQKSLHRVTATSDWSVEWLLEWLRISKWFNAWVVEGNLATIPHLTGEQLSAYRVPMPPPRDCHQLLAELAHEREHLNRIEDINLRQVDLLTERRQALIAASVTGELDIPRVPA